MAYQDTMATCEQCGKQFVFRVEEQRAQESAGERRSRRRRCAAPAAATSRWRRPRLGLSARLSGIVATTEPVATTGRARQPQRAA